jgi:hypothetical protein
MKIYFVVVYRKKLLLSLSLSLSLSLYKSGAFRFLVSKIHSKYSLVLFSLVKQIKRNQKCKYKCDIFLLCVLVLVFRGSMTFERPEDFKTSWSIKTYRPPFCPHVQKSSGRFEVFLLKLPNLGLLGSREIIDFQAFYGYKFGKFL